MDFKFLSYTKFEISKNLNCRLSAEADLCGLPGGLLHARLHGGPRDLPRDGADRLQAFEV